MKSRVAPLLMAGALLAAGCSGEETPQIPNTDLKFEEIVSNPHAKVIKPGEMHVMLSETDGALKDRLIGKIAIIDHHYDDGFVDHKAPEISTTPIRVDAHVSLGGDNAGLNNDLACDALRLNLDHLNHDAAYIVALSLSDESDDRASVAWLNDGGISSVIVCTDESKEPQDGIILVASDKAR